MDRHDNSLDILNYRFFIIFPIFRRFFSKIVLLGQYFPIYWKILIMSRKFFQFPSKFSLAGGLGLDERYGCSISRVICTKNWGQQALNIGLLSFPLPMWDWFSNLNRKTTFKGSYWRIELLTLMMGRLPSTIIPNVLFPINANQIMYIFYIWYIIY